MSKIKTLAIAPYTGLKTLINELAHERSDLEVHTFVADMLDGVELVKSIQNEGFNAIISRAGTAELIRKITELPVIDIKLSVIDMMQAIKLAQNYSGKFVVVGYKSITDTASLVCQLIQYKVDIKTISNIQEIEGCLTELKNNGVSLIVGDVITSQHAKNIGLNTVLVNSGRESVLNAFDEVIQFHHLLSIAHKKNFIAHKLLENAEDSIVSYDMKKQPFFTNIKEEFDNRGELLEETKELIDILIKEKEFKITKKLGEQRILIKGMLIPFENTYYPTFYIKKHESPIKLTDNAITYTHLLDLPQINFNTFFTSNGIFKDVLESARSYATTQAPLLILGEKGTGKDSIAHAIYQASHYNKNSLITIDSNDMNEKKWISLFESENSLFLNNEFTIYIKNIQCINEPSQRLFESYFLHSYVHKRNRFIFSCNSGDASFNPSGLLNFIKDKLNAFPLNLPNLNQRKEDIPSLASIYLSELNLKYGKQVIALEDEALSILQDFNWTHNLDQFQRVIEEMIVITDTYYITPKTVHQVLSNETNYQNQSYLTSFDLTKSLDDINIDIIEYVLREEDYNQSKAAERLGISRSTLWRKLKIQ